MKLTIIQSMNIDQRHKKLKEYNKLTNNNYNNQLKTKWIIINLKNKINKLLIDVQRELY